MGFNIRWNVIDGNIKITPPTMEYPNSQYFASMTNSKSWIKGYGSLVQGVLQKFPFQPKMPGFHPALRYNFQALKLTRGSLFRYKMKRIEQQFYMNLKESSRHKDMEFRKLARKLFLLLERELHVQRSLNAREKKYYKMFEDKAEIRFAKDRDRLKRWIDRLHIHAHKLKEMYKEIDKENADYIKKFWADYDKNREIKPRVISMGGASLQAILNELPWTEASSLWRVFELIKENKMNLYSEQIAESYDGALPPELIGKKIYFNKRIWEQVQRKLKKIELYQENKEFNNSYMDERRVKSKINYDKFVDKVFKARQDFVDYWDHIHEKWPVRLNVATTNLTAAHSQYRKANAAVIHAYQEKIKDSLLIARADTMIESMSHSIPSEVLFNYGVYQPHRDQLKPYNPEDMKAIRHQQRKENETLKFWKDRDHALLEVRKQLNDRKDAEIVETVKEADQKIQTHFEIERRQANAYSSRTDDKLVKDRAPRFNPEQSERNRKIAQSQFPKYHEVLQFTIGFADDRDRSDIKNLAQFHAMRRNDARLEDHAVQTDETVRQKADWHNKVYKERSGSTDAYFRNRWSSNHNESLIPVNYQDQALRELVKPITDNSDFTPVQEEVKEVAKTYSPESIRKYKKK